MVIGKQGNEAGAAALMRGNAHEAAGGRHDAMGRWAMAMRRWRVGNKLLEGKCRRRVRGEAQLCARESEGRARGVHTYLRAPVPFAVAVLDFFA